MLIFRFFLEGLLMFLIYVGSFFLWGYHIFPIFSLFALLMSPVLWFTMWFKRSEFGKKRSYIAIVIWCIGNLIFLDVDGSELIRYGTLIHSDLLVLWGRFIKLIYQWIPVSDGTFIGIFIVFFPIQHLIWGSSWMGSWIIAYNVYNKEAKEIAAYMRSKNSIKNSER